MIWRVNGYSVKDINRLVKKIKIVGEDNGKYIFIDFLILALFYDQNMVY